MLLCLDEKGCIQSDLKTRLAKLSATDQLTGEIRLNQYMETASDQVYGVVADDFYICTRIHIWKIKNKPIVSELDQDTGQVGLVNRSDPTYRLESGRNVTLREKDPLRNVNVTGNFEEIPYVNESPLEFCQ